MVEEGLVTSQCETDLPWKGGADRVVHGRGKSHEYRYFPNVNDNPHAVEGGVFIANGVAKDGAKSGSEVSLLDLAKEKSFSK